MAERAAVVDRQPLALGAGAVILLVGSALPAASISGASTLQIIVALTVLFTTLGFVLNVLEGRLFSSKPLPIGLRHAIGAMLIALLTASCTALLAGAPDAVTPLDEHLASFLDGRSVTTTIVQYAGAGLTYVGVHGVIGSSIWPFVRRYYEDPQSQLDLRLPPPGIMLAFQAGRGVVGVAAMLPWLILVPVDGWAAWWRLALLLSVTMGIVPLLSMHTWPARLRWVHAAEIAAIATIWSLLIWWIAAP